MSIYITKDGQKKKVNVSATDVQLLDIDGRFKSKNLEDALKEVGSGTEENMTRIERIITNIENQVATISNPNLLINGDFQVWQRGTSFHQETMTYCADRWLIAGENTYPKVEKTNNGVKITSTRNGAWTNFLTRLENATLKKLIGKTLTYTIKLKVPTKISQVWSLTNSPSGVIYHHVKQYIDKNYEYLTGSFVVKSTELNDNSCFEFGIQGIPEANNSFEIEYAKLELGTVATPFVPRPYSQELADCQRYYESITCSTRLVVDMSTLGHGVEMSAPFKVKKRVNPTLTVTKTVVDISSMPDPTVTTWTDDSSMDYFNAFLPSSSNSQLKTGARIFYYGTADAEIY